MRSLGLALIALVLAGCGNDRVGGSQVPPAPTPTTANVTGIAGATNEDGEPFPINNGAFAFNDTTETGEPRSINR